MKKLKNKCISKLAVQLLTWLGIGSASMLFVACYGAAPRGYEVIDDGDTIAVVLEDSVVMTASPDEASIDTAATDDLAQSE